LCLKTNDTRETKLVNGNIRYNIRADSMSVEELIIIGAARFSRLCKTQTLRQNGS